VFPLKVLNRLRTTGEVAAETIPTLPNHRAWIFIRPQVDLKKAEWDKINRRWQRIYVDENILTGFKVNYIEIEAEQIGNHSIFDTDIEPTINERFHVNTEHELVVLVSRWLSDFSGFHTPNNVDLSFCFEL